MQKALANSRKGLTAPLCTAFYWRAQPPAGHGGKVRGFVLLVRAPRAAHGTVLWHFTCFLVMAKGKMTYFTAGINACMRKLPSTNTLYLQKWTPCKR